MRLRTRGRWGIQAGIMAGMAVAAAVFVLDLVRSEPLATPLFLSQWALESLGPDGQDDIVQTLAGLTLGGRLAVFTGLHLAVFALIGMLAAALANLFHVRWTYRTGAAVGLGLGILLWFGASRMGTSWLAGAGLSAEVVVGASVIGGAVLGWHLRLCHLDAEEAPPTRRHAA
ncbi:MAG: hypothetical protein M8866_03210 [marine benthic group bacterium]|nr:hypothetical protein [Candidatus Benthicola marisminoris]